MKFLEKNGFLISDITESVVFTYVTKKEEWEDVLKLRLSAAHHAGRWIDLKDHKSMTDEHDKHARILICKVGEKVIGSCRMVFNEGSFDKSEYKNISKLPDFLWKGGFIETSRLCIDPEYRGANLFLLFLQHTGRIAAQSKYRYVIINGEDTLVPIYTRFGGIELGIRFFTKFMQKTALNLLYYDLNHVLYGKNVNPIAWHLLIKDLQKHLEKSKILKPNFIQKVYRARAIFFSKILINTFMASKIRKMLDRRSDELLSFKDTPPEEC